MKKTYAVFVAGDEYTCTEFYDVDSNRGGVEVKLATDPKKVICTVYGVSIPDVDFPDDDDVQYFEQQVEDAIVETF